MIPTTYRQYLSSDFRKDQYTHFCQKNLFLFVSLTSIFLSVLDELDQNPQTRSQRVFKRKYRMTTKATKFQIQRNETIQNTREICYLVPIQLKSLKNRTNLGLYGSSERYQIMCGRVKVQNFEEGLIEELKTFRKYNTKQTESESLQLNSGKFDRTGKAKRTKVFIVMKVANLQTTHSF